MLPASDARGFDQLKALLDTEPTSIASPDRLGMLATLGIVNGQPFTPDAKRRAILDDAAKTGYKMSRVVGFQSDVAGRSLPRLPRSSLAQSDRRRNACESRRPILRPWLGQKRRLHRPRHAHLVLYRLYWACNRKIEYYDTGRILMQAQSTTTEKVTSEHTTARTCFGRSQPTLQGSAVWTLVMTVDQARNSSAVHPGALRRPIFVWNIRTSTPMRGCAGRTAVHVLCLGREITLGLPCLLQQSCGK